VFDTGAQRHTDWDWMPSKTIMSQK
jgi:hypothetical protein